MTIKATTRNIDSVQVDDHKMQFSKKNGMFMTKDPGLAKEIEARYGRKGEETPGLSVTVPIHNAGREAGHRYSFSVPELPWKKQEGENNGES